MFIVDFDTVCCSPQMPPHLVVGDHVYTHWLYISDTPEKNICFHASPFPPFHTPFLSPRYTALQTFMVDLFMRWGSILALGLSLRWGSYCLFLLTAFVVFINITFWHSDIHALPEDRGKNKKSFLIAPNLPSTLSQLWQEDSDCFCWNGGRFEISCCSASLRGQADQYVLHSLQCHLCFCCCFLSMCVLSVWIRAKLVWWVFTSRLDLFSFGLIGQVRQNLALVARDISLHYCWFSTWTAGGGKNQ